MKKLARSKRTRASVEIVRETSDKVVLVFGWDSNRPRRWECSAEHFNKHYFRIP